MAMNQSTSTKQISPAASNILSIVSGAYTANFWDGILEVSGALETLQELRSSIDTLCALQKEQEAFTLVLALYDLTAMEIPTSILEIRNFPEAVSAFMCEFLADTEDLMLTEELSAIQGKPIQTERFLRLIRKYKEPTELTEEMLHDLLDKVVIHEPEGGSGKNRTQEIELLVSLYSLWQDNAC